MSFSTTPIEIRLLIAAAVDNFADYKSLQAAEPTIRRFGPSRTILEKLLPQNIPMKLVNELYEFASFSQSFQRLFEYCGVRHHPVIVIDENPNDWATYVFKHKFALNLNRVVVNLLNNDFRAHPIKIFSGQLVLRTPLAKVLYGRVIRNVRGRITGYLAQFIELHLIRHLRMAVLYLANIQHLDRIIAALLKIRDILNRCNTADYFSFFSTSLFDRYVASLFLPFVCAVTEAKFTNGMGTSNMENLLSDMTSVWDPLLADAYKFIAIFEDLIIAFRLSTKFKQLKRHPTCSSFSEFYLLEVAKLGRKL